jgi:hypothetical protein
VKFFWVLEWNKQGRRHWHLLLRAAAPLETEQFGEWWRKSLPVREGVTGRHYCRPVRNADGVARYVVKDTTEGGSSIPGGFRGRLFGYSKQFLSRRLKDLWAAVRNDWFRK